MVLLFENKALPLRQQVGATEPRLYGFGVSILTQGRRLGLVKAGSVETVSSHTEPSPRFRKGRSHNLSMFVQKLD